MILLQFFRRTKFHQIASNFSHWADSSILSAGTVSISFLIIELNTEVVNSQFKNDHYQWLTQKGTGAIASLREKNLNFCYIYTEFNTQMTGNPALSQRNFKI